MELVLLLVSLGFPAPSILLGPKNSSEFAFYGLYSHVILGLKLFSPTIPVP